MQPTETPKRKFLLAIYGGKSKYELPLTLTRLLERGYLIYGDISTADIIAEYGIQCHDFTAGPALEEELKSFDVVFMDVYNENKEEFYIERKGGRKLRHLLDIVKARHKQGGLLLLKVSQLLLFAEVPDTGLGSTEAETRAWRESMQMETDILLRGSDLEKPKLAEKTGQTA